ncbi:RidA family protein [Gimesia aquarii]|uniref:Endoribonuclease L-PSP n=1 Tax=Gimesia aquarii TaxID=2527964 RepID=A0A517WN74_9PLAN|nr:RidA family protein [Gimesia aquarii]QDU06685.1 Endoribonuclease L-PSP [Gimesia aquarii]
MSVEAKIQELQLELPEAPKPGGIYNPVVQVDDLLYVSGHGPVKLDGTMHTGRVGDDLTEEQGVEAAEAVGLTMLATLKQYLGDLDRIERFIKVLGMVNAAPDFQRHPQVINGFSNLIVQILGENGRAARSAVGMGSLPGNIAVEVEAIVQIKS